MQRRNARAVTVVSSPAIHMGEHELQNTYDLFYRNLSDSHTI